MLQQTDEWYKARTGKVTASRMADVTAKTRNGWGASRANYMAELIAERMTGVPADSYVNASMQWGLDKEPEAKAAYEFFNDIEILSVGFIRHPEISDSGASPDGIIGEGLVEIKCPNTSTHIDFLLSRSIPDKYIKQMQWQMACTKKQWCDFVSYDPRMPSNMNMFIYRVERDDALIKDLYEHVVTFLAELYEKETKLREIYDGQA